jgi:hypothetical protein
MKTTLQTHTSGMKKKEKKAYEKLVIYNDVRGHIVGFLADDDYWWVINIVPHGTRKRVKNLLYKLPERCRILIDVVKEGLKPLHFNDDEIDVLISMGFKRSLDKDGNTFIQRGSLSEQAILDQIEMEQIRERILQDAIKPFSP